MENQKFVTDSFTWATQAKGAGQQESVSQTRDVFRARLDRFYKDLANAEWSEEDCALLTAAIGEIGNNCFDHNLGQWHDDPGCWFEWKFIEKSSRCLIVVADRGQGIFSSLSRMDRDIKTDQDAVNVAFSKILSGRSPEKRGNGLKFVRQIVNGNSKRGLLFLSGKGRMVLGTLGSAAEGYVLHPQQDNPVIGTWALLLGEKL